jgi:hypothetical protein
MFSRPRERIATEDESKLLLQRLRRSSVRGAPSFASCEFVCVMGLMVDAKGG